LPPLRILFQQPRFHHLLAESLTQTQLSDLTACV